MTYKELATSLREAKPRRNKLPAEDFDVVRMFSPRTMSKHILDWIVSESRSLQEFNLRINEHEF
jgi:hypothetical protein